MAPILLRHATAPERAEKIRAEGLKPHRPAGPGGNFNFLQEQPEGIYAAPLEADVWKPSRGEVVFTFAYVGPMMPDPLVKGAFVVPFPVTADCLTEGEPC